MRSIPCFFVYLLLVISTLISCKSTKNASDFREKSQTHIRSEDSITTDLHLKVAEQILMNELISEGWDVDFKIFLPPDSNGIQPLKMEGKVRKSKQTQHVEQRLHNKDETSTAKQKKIQNTASSRETHDKAENFKFSEPSYVMKYAAYILYALLAFTLIYIFKKWLR